MAFLRAFLLSFCWVSLAVAQGASDEWSDVTKALGRTGQVQADGVYKVTMPRRDLKVMADGVEVKPGFALGAWLAFHRMHGEVQVMGDLVLTEEELAPVMESLVRSGIEITGVHNHLKGESPRILYMHIEGMGSAEKLGAVLRTALTLTKTPMPPATPGPATELGLDTKMLDRIVGRAGKNNGGVYQFAVPRAETIREGDAVVPNSMGLATSINFQSLGRGQAAITGDFVLLGKEVNPVIRALHAHGIQATALHSHMLHEEPRLFFMHFWAKGDSAKLAEGLAAALRETNMERATPQ